MEFVLHLGPHRTATTAFQNTCRDNEAILAEHKIDYWGPDIMREPDIAKFVQAARDAQHKPDAGRSVQRTKKLVTEAMDRHRANGVRQIIVTEENIIGTMVNNFATHSLFPQAAERLGFYRDMFEHPPHRIFLCMREYSDFWTSSYSYAALRNDLPDLEEIASKLAMSDRGWFDLVKELAEVFPDTEICIWRHASDPRTTKGLFREVLGHEFAEKLTYPRKLVNPRVNASGLKIGRRLFRENPNMSYRELIKAIKAMNPDASEALQPFSDEELAEMSERFEDEWASLEFGSIENVTIFDPLASDAGSFP